MRFSRNGLLPALGVVLCVASLLGSCGGAAVAAGGYALSPARTPERVEPDGLACAHDERVAVVVERLGAFAGYPTPQAAVAAVAAAVPIRGTPELADGGTWLVVSDGLAVALTDVEPWEQGWYASTIVACARVSQIR